MKTLIAVLGLLVMAQAATDHSLKYIGNSYANVPDSIRPENPPSESPCCIPKQYQYTLVRHPASKSLHFTAKVSVDQTEKVMALEITATYTQSKNSTTYTQIIQWNESTKTTYIYQFDKVAKKCVRFDFVGVSFEDVIGASVPKGSFYVGVYAMDGDTLRSWSWKPYAIQLPELREERLVNNDCAAVMQTYRGTIKNKNYLQVDMAIKISVGPIRDHSVFNIASNCQQDPTVTKVNAADREAFLAKLLETGRDGQSAAGYSSLFIV
jgi:hypothetical protein